MNLQRWSWLLALLILIGNSSRHKSLDLGISCDTHCFDNSIYDSIIFQTIGIANHGGFPILQKADDASHESFVAIVWSLTHQYLLKAITNI